MKKQIILGIESSCDDTALSLYDTKLGVLSEHVYTQLIHRKFHGTVPELSSRDHLKKILSLMLFTLKRSGVLFNKINIVAYTFGPGLAGSLIIGAVFAKALSFGLRVPAIAVNHLKAHISIIFILNKIILFPSIALLISGAHTMIFKLFSYRKHVFIEGTLDDSVGEAFDKIARYLNLFPCNGIMIEQNSKFEINMINLFLKINYKYISFSGLKTKVRLLIEQKYKITVIAYNFQFIAIKLLLSRIIFILEKCQIFSLIVSGGVAANSELRKVFFNYSISKNIKLFFPKKKHCTDNGTMIAFLGFLQALKHKFDKNLFVFIKPKINF